MDPDEAAARRRARMFVLQLHLVFGTSLPRTSFGANTMFVLESGAPAPHGFEISLRWFEREGMFPHDGALARTLTINALAKLHRDSDAIAGIE